jgi:rhodanese-related sulfurtransferase
MDRGFSARAARALHEQGFKNVLIVDGGFPAYKKAGYELAPRGSPDHRAIVVK